MLEKPPVPQAWRTFRRQQGAGAALFLTFAALGLLATFGGQPLIGLMVALVAGSLGGFGLLLATSGRRGARAVRLRTLGDQQVTEFPVHVTGGLLTGLLLAGLGAGTLWVLVLLGLAASRGSLGATVGGIAVVGLLGWLARTLNQLPSGHRGLGAVRLGRDGVEVTGVLGGSVIGWDREPVPVPWANGVLRLVPTDRLVELATSRRERRRDLWRASEGWIAPGGVDADLAVVAAAVGFYLAHPERRMELSSPAAAERIRSGGLMPPWGPDA